VYFWNCVVFAVSVDNKSFPEK